MTNANPYRQPQAANLTLPQKCRVAWSLLEKAIKPRAIRKALNLSGRQFKRTQRAFRAVAKGELR